MEKLSLDAVKNVLILGATGGIGAALVDHLLAANPELTVYTLARSPITNPRVYCTVCEHINEASLTDFFAAIPGVKFDLVINTIGYLVNELGGPEKGLRDIDEKRLLEYFRVNAVITPLLAKALRSHLSSTAFAFVVLSAMVGSIGENELGGWYGYRASKAALNAFLKNIAIEWKRTHKHSLVLAVHPGTTQTRLSEKFTAGITHKIHTPSEAAQNICRVVFETPFERSGSFLNWDGRVIAW